MSVIARVPGKRDRAEAKFLIELVERPQRITRRYPVKSRGQGHRPREDRDKQPDPLQKQEPIHSRNQGQHEDPGIEAAKQPEALQKTDGDKQKKGAQKFRTRVQRLEHSLGTNGRLLKKHLLQE